MKGTPKELSNYLWTLEPDKIYEIKEFKEKRSLNANAYFHLLVNKLARYYNLSDEEMKIKMNLDYGTVATDENKVIGSKFPKGTDPTQFYPYMKWIKEEDGWDCYIYYKETHKLNTKEFSQLLEGVVQECRDVGIETKEDLEIKKLMEDYEVKYGTNKNVIK